MERKWTQCPTVSQELSIINASGGQDLVSPMEHYCVNQTHYRVGLMLRSRWTTQNDLKLFMYFLFLLLLQFGVFLFIFIFEGLGGCLLGILFCIVSLFLFLFFESDKEHERRI